MKLLKYFLPLIAFLACNNLFGDEGDGKTQTKQDKEESDMIILNDFINAKRKIPLSDKLKNLKISGEIHTEWNYYTEKINGKNIRTYVFDEEESFPDEIFLPGERILIGPNDYDIEADLFFDWDTECTWARMHLRFDNSAGVNDNGKDEEIDPGGFHGSGDCRSICLKEAYVGYEVFKCGDARLTLELGRRGALYKVFYSELEFDSRLDGAILKFTKPWKGVADAYLTWAGFVVDERPPHYGWAVELGLLNIKNTGVELRYSYINWEKWGINRYFVRHPLGHQFKVSQVSAVYNMPEEWFCDQPMQVFGGVLVNHIPSGRTHVFVRFDPKKHDPNCRSDSSSESCSDSKKPPVIITGPKGTKFIQKKINIGKNHNWGGFIGFQYRDIHKAGDWVIRGLLAFCEAQCMPDDDQRNIGTGNSLNQSFTAYGRGWTNWKGYAIKFGYAITNNWVIEVQYDHSWSLNTHMFKKDGINPVGTHGYSRFALETTYSF